MAKQGYDLPERVLEILVKNQLGLSKPTVVYDLEFDTALNAALKLVDDPSYPKLLADAKSVKVLVEAKKAADPKAKAAAKSVDKNAGGQGGLPAPAPKN